jgi:hypothetical protein
VRQQLAHARVGQAELVALLLRSAALLGNP